MTISTEKSFFIEGGGGVLFSAVRVCSTSEVMGWPLLCKPITALRPPPQSFTSRHSPNFQLLEWIFDK